MHSSGINVTEEFRSQWVSLLADKGDALSNVQIGIVEDSKFSILGSGDRTGTDEGDWEKIAGDLDDKTPLFICKRSASDDDEWALIVYVPDKAQVRQKMVWASSTGALKSLRNFNEYPISTKEECTLTAFHKFRAGIDHTETVMSYDEKLGKQTAYEHASAMSETKRRALVGVPITVEDAVVESLKNLQGGGVNTVVLKLDGTTEVMSVDAVDNMDLASIRASHMNPEEPRYIVHSYEHMAKGESATKILFIYFCPGKAKPKLKMFYSTCKQNMLQIFANLELTDYTNFEYDTAEELKAEDIDDELYPKVAVSTAFKKPAARGRGRAKVTKFKA